MISDVKQDKSERIVDLCIWVDNHVYKDNIDHNLLFLNIQKIIYALAIKQRIFTNWSDYEPFSLVAATRIYRRYFNKRQFLPDGDPKKITKIKSVLNYVKTLMYPMKVAYQNETFKETLKPELHLEHIDAIREQSLQRAQQQQNDILASDVKYYLNKITFIIKDHLKELPYSADPVIAHNLYISCLLSILNSITLSNTVKAKLQSKEIRTSNIEEFLYRVYADAKERSIILFHLPQSMSNYVATAVARIRHRMGKDLKELIGMNAVSNEICEAMLVTQAQEMYVE